MDLSNQETPLGQIWEAAANKDAKINRRELKELDIPNICDQIENLTHPMRDQLSEILFDGVVNVYERKVKLLCDDLTPLLKKAFKEIKPGVDPTVHSEGMRLDDVDMQSIDPSQQHHPGLLEETGPTQTPHPVITDPSANNNTQFTLTARKMQHSSAKSNFGNLYPVEEEGPLEQDVRSFKIPTLSQKGSPFDSGLLEENVPTQTPHAVIADPSADNPTQVAMAYLKRQFDDPGVLQHKLEDLASSMNRMEAAEFVYQTCVLATLDYVEVHQEKAYGEIDISKGPKM